MLKTVAIWTGSAGLVWKAFSFLKAATDTAKQIPAFMTQMSEGMTDLQGHARTAVTNHLEHIESGIGTLGDVTGRLADNMGNFHEKFENLIDDSKDFQKTVLERLPEI